MIRKEGSVRVDLFGGTIDLSPINLVIPNVVTLNFATSLKAKVSLELIDFEGIEFVSTDYDITVRFNSFEFSRKNIASDYFGNFKFFVHLLDYFKIQSGLRITMSSGSPPGAGLGGSSAMGVVFFSAICEYKKIDLERDEIIRIVNNMEGMMLDSGPAGYQDYYPALYGGVLALVPGADKVQVHQLYSKELRKFIEENITLVYSGENRFSGINNWEVYKAFFDKNELVRNGLFTIAELSYKAYQSILTGDLTALPELISKEGEERNKLFPGIMTAKMTKFYDSLKGSVEKVGIKVCGAGGGGCFILIHQKDDLKVIEEQLEKFEMKKLSFKIEEPIN